MKDLTEGNEGKLILMFAIPMLLGNVFQQMYNIIDSMIVGHYVGKEGLAAVGASFPVIFLLISLLIGISSGATIIISQYYGAKDFENVKKAIDTLYIFIFFASIFITAIGTLFSGFIFEMIKLPQEIVPMAKLYLHIYFAGVILIAGFNGMSAILRGLGDSKTPLYFLILSTVINIILDFILIAGFNMGVAGAAISTIISEGFAFWAVVNYLNRKHKIINLSIRKFEFDREIFKKAITIGLPSGIQQTFVALGMIALFGIVNGFGTDTIAAFSVASRIDSFATLPAMNFSIALTTFVGQNIGAGKLDRVRKGYFSTLIMTSVISIGVTLLVLFGSHSLMHMFTVDSKVIDIGSSYLLIVSTFYIVFGGMFITNGLFRGAGDTLIPMFITLVSLWLIRIPFSYFLSRKFGTDGIWWGIPIAWIIGLIFAYAYYVTGKWKRKAIVCK